MKIPELSSKLKSDENSRITIQILINTQPFWRSIADCAKPKKVQLQFLSTPQLVAINTQDETKEEKKARRAARKVRCVSAQKLVTNSHTNKVKRALEGKDDDTVLIQFSFSNSSGHNDTHPHKHIHKGGRRNKEEKGENSGGRNGAVFAISTQLTEQCSHKNTQIRRQKKNANSAKMSLSR